MSSEPFRWVLATTNAGKLREFRQLLAAADIEIVSLAELGLEPPAETGQTFVENALLKARHASELARMPAIADDSGLVVPALGGIPGVRSARFAGEAATDQGNNARLLELLEARTATERAAAFHCALVAVRAPTDPAPLVATGTWKGQIATAPRGSGGFGYDPIFVDPATGLTAAELSPEQKNASSHRARAAQNLLRELIAG